MSAPGRPKGEYRSAQREGTPVSTHTTFQPGLLRNKALFITGGGSGINRQIALTCAIAGAAVTIVGSSVEKARDAAAEIEASGGLAIGLSADVRNCEALRDAVEC
jgi:NAD(P)-dependent dehydrogenase (short-subunit alcohol dehydrogenase family)